MNLASSVLNDRHEVKPRQHTAAGASLHVRSTLGVIGVIFAAASTCLACSSSGSDAPASNGAAGASGSSAGGSSAGGSSAGGTNAGGASAGGGAGDGGAAGATGLGDYDPTPVGGDRPTKVYVPTAYDGAPMPLVVLLHGYSASGALQELLFQLKPQAEMRGFLYVHPDGTPDAMDKRFWNATDACCDFGTPKVDDVAYLSGLVDEIKTRWAVDPKRIYFAGHSNGAFMSHRMACDRADMVAGIAALAGDNWEDVSKCQPSSPVAVVQIHGTADDTIAYAGGMIGAATFPSATQSVMDWVMLDGCDPTPDTSLPALDLDTGLAGNETTIQRWNVGCKSGTEAQLWTIAGGAHVPALGPAFAPAIVDFLFAHTK